MRGLSLFVLLAFLPACHLSHVGPERAGDGGPGPTVDARVPVDGGSSDAGPPDPTWSWSSPLPHGVDLHAVWGSSARDVWAVGALGIVVHFDGRGWSIVDTDVTTSLNGIWGSAPDDVWVVGGETVWEPTGAGSGLLLHWDGRTWTTLEIGTSGLFGVWGTARDDVWAVGHGTVLHFDGREWSTSVSGLDLNLLAVWAGARDDVWAVGDYQPVLHYDGRAWSEVITGAEPEGTGGAGGVIGFGPDDVWSCSPIRGLEHWDGSTWTDADAPRLPAWNVWGRASDDVWAVGPGGSAQHWDGRAWSRVPSGVDRRLRGVWASAPNDAWLVGDTGAILHWDGVSLSPITPVTPNHELYGVWASGPDDAWAVGFFRTDVGSSIEQRTMIVHWDGASWSVSPSGILGPSYSMHLHAVWGARADEVWAVGGEGTILRWNGLAWTSVESGTREGLEGVWGSRADDVWAVGYGGIQHWDGESWSTSDGTWGLHAVSGQSARDVWAVGDHGTVLHWDGDSWTRSTLPDDGRRLDLRGVWAGGASDVWVVGTIVTGTAATDGILLHYDGRTWTSTPAPVLEDVWGRASDDVWAVGDGVVLHHDGRTWEESADLPRGVGPLHGVGGRGDGDVWAVGSMGTILSRR